MIVLPGGKVSSEQMSRPWQLANVRMALFAASLRRQLGPAYEVRRVRYRMRGWNSPRLDALHDAQAALNTVRRRYAPDRISLVGHSMGGRVAAHLAADAGVRAVVALAPWWVGNDGDLIPVTTKLLVLHGTSDSWTSPQQSWAQTIRAQQRGLSAHWTGLDGAGHYMVRRWGQWHRLAGDFIAEHLAPAR